MDSLLINLLFQIKNSKQIIVFLKKAKSTSYLPLLNFNMPYNLLQFFNVISQATNLQLVDVTHIKQIINPEGEMEYDQEMIYGINFQLMGFSSYDIYENMGPELLLFLMNLAMYVVIMFTRFIKEVKIFKAIHKYLVNKFIFDFGLRLVLELYLYYCVVIGLQYYQHLIYPQFTRNASLLIALGSFLLLAVFPILNLIIILKLKSNNGLELYFSPLIEDLRSSDFKSKLQRILFMLRRISFVLSIFILGNSPAIQIFFNQLICILEIVFIIKIRPFSKILSNRMEVLNNVLYLFICTGYLLLTNEYDYYLMKVNSSWVIMSMIAIILVSNIAIIILSFVKKSMKYLRRKRRQIKRNRKMKQIMSLNDYSSFLTTQGYLNTNGVKNFTEESEIISTDNLKHLNIENDKTKNNTNDKDITNHSSLNFKSQGKNWALDQIDEVITDNEDGPTQQKYKK
ncbi:UNKNOWN [Stylonychia lemnae]|uniref:TRP C-terminal domain-containing protein n=1 Tax=Stylonychia lemnae TaxID=5949 RepID=A0A078A8I8_STYLE|nr:UNKNOWN [Stylonychia lemnae]|eukprot:CDW78534.1 UNKNOWN [Stylonychia lemnae]